MLKFHLVHCIKKKESDVFIQQISVETLMCWTKINIYFSVKVKYLQTLYCQ